jgi:hypothetical protein
VSVPSAMAVSKEYHDQLNARTLNLFAFLFELQIIFEPLLALIKFLKRCLDAIEHERFFCQTQQIGSINI